MEFNRAISIGVNLFLILIASPLFVGIINRVKSIFAGRKGPPILQLYYDILKLMRKDLVYSRTTSYVFRAAPFFILASLIISGLLLPITGLSPIYFRGDVILFVYLFAFVRFWIIAASLDTGSSFEGMGASREAAFGAFAELTTFTSIVTLVVVTHSLSLDGIFQGNGEVFIKNPSSIILFLAFFFILLTENARMPVDDPNTHLELTMIHEVMILDYSGSDLGVMLYSSSIKLFIFMAFCAMLLFPGTSENIWINSGTLLLKVTVLSVVIGVVESVTARIRLIRIPQFLIASFVLSVFSLFTALFVRGKL